MTDRDAGEDGAVVYAEVAVAIPTRDRRATFVYYAPSSLNLRPGHLVDIPLRTRHGQGIVLRVDAARPAIETRPIAGLVDPRPVVTSTQIALAGWIADTYLVPLGLALESMVPAGLRASSDVELSLRAGDREPGRLSERDARIVDYLRASGPTRLRQLQARLDLGRAGPIVARLARRGIVNRTPIVVGPRAASLSRWIVSLTEAGCAELDRIGHSDRAPRQAEVLAFLRQQAGQRVAIEYLRAETGADATTVRALARRGYVRVEDAPPPPRSPTTSPATDRALELTADQARAVRRLIGALDAPRPFLLHGITASGKTEVYLRLIEAAIRRGRRALVLIPEIVLTPQAVHRYGARFPGRVAVVHGRLPPRERLDTWRRVRDGEVDVVVGTLSALYMPIAELGVVIVDEEHEPSYKQQAAPRVHARDAAVALGRLAGAVVVLGSATPDASTYARSWRGEIERIEMSRRVAASPDPGGLAGLPPVEVVDLRRTPLDGDSAFFSQRLLGLIGETLDRREQVILYLNRRGSAPLILCAECGEVPRCQRCDTALVYHQTDGVMICHLCNRRTRPWDRCASCQSTRVQYLGAGTQRVVAEVERLFPAARVLRWDRDAMTRSFTAEELTRRLVEREADVLVGTQAIAKGLDLPAVTLVGIVSADTMLHLPDVRAAERTFQLITQVAGRAGRGQRPGRVILQTYSPDHACIRAAAHQDYASFMRAELRFRREHGFPPFAELARGVFAATNEATTRAATARQAAALRAEIARLGLAQTEILGPAPCFHRRVRGRFRWQVIARGRDVRQLVGATEWPAGWTLDLDPISLL